MTCAWCSSSSSRAPQLKRRLPSSHGKPAKLFTALLSPTALRCTSQRRRIRQAAEGSAAPPPGTLLASMVFQQSPFIQAFTFCCPITAPLWATAEEIDWSKVKPEELEPIPIQDQNIKPGQGDEAAGEDVISDGVNKREEEAWNRREGYLSYFFVRFEPGSCFCDDGTHVFVV